MTEVFEKGTIQRWVYDYELKNTLLEEDNLVNRIRNLSADQLIGIYHNYYDTLVEKTEKRLNNLQIKREKF